MVDFFSNKVGTNAAEEASSSSEPPRLSSRAVAKAYMLYVLGYFLFPTKKWTDVSPKYLNFFESKNSDITWSWRAATLAHLYYNLGASSRVNAKALACCTTLLEESPWIFEHFLKLPGILEPNDSRGPEYCTRWSWSRMASDRSGEEVLKTFREALDNYKLEDVVWDPYLEKRADRHVFKKVASFTSFIRGPEHIVAYYSDRVELQFNQRQYIPSKPICLEDSNLRYFEWFKEVSFTKLCPTAVNLDENDDGRILGDGGAVGGSVRSPIGGGIGSAVGGGVGNIVVGGGFSQREHVQGQNEDIISRLEEEISNLKFAKENLECSSLKEVNKKLSEDVSSLKKTLEDLNVQLQNKVDECENLASIIEKLMDDVVNLQPQPLAKSVFSQTLDVACNDLGERRYDTLLRAFKFSGVFVEYLYMGHLLATHYEKVVIFISNKEALTFLPMFWPKENNKISKLERFENILVDSSKYWWVGMTSDKNFVKLKTKYLSPIPPVSTLWWAHVQLEILDDFMKQTVKTNFNEPN
ncbi:hypothetical protein GIB67_011986 [Kingdonia uniflora]|uniref:Aminotransferase-like plant mobile domain-containing protein n=1 Tax=Kingdonia uniflora TaxID=39325 RepID=A0A7J7M005_9MAGN|nr:hypothetical protein GIB67_011986 [Kingdonia uniflora]